MSGTRSLTMGPLEWGMLVLLSIFWGGSFLFVGIAVSDFPAFTIAFLRVAIAQMTGLTSAVRVGSGVSAIAAFVAPACGVPPVSPIPPKLGRDLKRTLAVVGADSGLP